MTANQVARASVNEDIRHNQAYEIEVERHNKATEELAHEQNRINEYAAQVEEWYKRENTRLTEEYNTKYLAYLEAAQDDKVMLESELNAIKDEQNHIQELYNEKVINIQQQNADINRDKYKEEVRSNQEKERQNLINLNLVDKQIEYENTYKIEANRLKDVDLSYQLQKLRNDYSLGLMNVEISSAKNLINKEQLDINWFEAQTRRNLQLIQNDLKEPQIKLMNAQTTNQYLTGTSKVVDTLIKPFEVFNWAFK